MEKTTTELLKKIDIDRLPIHIAVIMDGNGRWAKSRRFKRIKGHSVGVETIRKIVTFSSRIGIKFMTMYAFSVENWDRPKYEVRKLMSLLETYLVNELETFQKNNIRFTVIGQVGGLSEKIQGLVEKNIRATKDNTGLTLILALNYSGRSEITDAVKRIAADSKLGLLDPESIDENVVSKYLYTTGIPDPDLLIRTSGEMRISNFLLWQISYSEIWITPVLWPDFTPEHLLEGILEYQKRDRRYGKV